MRYASGLAAMAGMLWMAAGTMAGTVADPVEGAWKGSLDVGGGAKLALSVFAAKGENGKIGVTVDSPDQKAFGFDADEAKVEGNVFTFKVGVLKAEFEGKLAADGKTATGTWTQGGKGLPATLEKVDPASLPKGPEVAKELKGLWEGKLKVQNTFELRLVVRVSPASGDPSRLIAVMDSPDQGANGIPISSATLKGGEVVLEIPAVQGTFKGKLDQKTGTLDGTWTQGGMDMPLVLKKTEKVSQVIRPQNPAGPLPYATADVSFENPDAEGVVLSGTLTTPKGDGPFPAAVLVSGSGPQDRDESLMGHKPFLVLADDLTRRGIAVLRYDDRGSAQSTGNFSKATTQDFASDALAAVRFLKTKKEIDGSKIGVIGHSEGGLVAPIVATKAPGELSYIVLMAGPGVPGDEIIIRQQGLILLAMGVSKTSVDVVTKVTTELMKLLREDADMKAIQSRLETVEAEVKAGLSEEDREALDKLDQGGDVEGRLDQMRTPWFKYFLTYDPRPTLRSVACPVLAVNGEKDLQVDPSQNLPEIEKALNEGGNHHFELVELPGLNHLFQPATTGSPTEYAQIETTIDPKALEAIGSWVVKTTAAE